MLPITVSVGPLQTASPNNISLSQTPNAAGLLLLNGTPAGGSLNESGQGVGSITGNLMTITSPARQFVAGQFLSGSKAIAPGTFITAPGQVANTWILNNAQTVASGNIFGDLYPTLDAPRQIVITTVADESGKTFTINGTDWAGSPITEQLTGPAIGTVTSVLSYKTVTSIAISAAASGAITVGTAASASSPWVRMDGFASQVLGLQCDVAGTVNYTVQSTFDDPNWTSNATPPAAMGWINSNDNGVVNATASAQSFYPFTPLWLRVVLNSGSGSVSMTVLQSGSVAK